MTQVKYYAVVPAAGIGSRFEHDTPKQFLSIKAKAIIEYALQPLLSNESIEQVVVAMTLPNPYWESLAIAKHPKILLTEGGDTRADSVLCGLLALADIAQDPDWVLVHDAARPCLTEYLVRKLINHVADQDHAAGGILGIPVRDTLKRVDQQANIVATVPRDQLWQAQTPQMCRYGLLKAALLHCIEEGKAITDEAQAMEYAGHSMLMIEGAVSNMKLTHPQDFGLIAQWLSDNEGQQ